jgi:hypothetical protein
MHLSTAHKYADIDNLCKACLKPVTDKQVRVVLEDVLLHVKCAVCVDCKRHLSSGRFNKIQSSTSDKLILVCDKHLDRHEALSSKKDIPFLERYEDPTA